MIPCAEVRRHLMDYQYGLLSEWEAEEVRAHLDGCPRCRAAEARARAGIAGFDRWRVPGPGAHLKAAFAHRAAAELGVSFRRPSLMERVTARLRAPVSVRSLALAGAAAVLLLWGGGRLLRKMQKPFLSLDGYVLDYRIAGGDRAGLFAGADHASRARWLERRTRFASLAPDLSAAGCAPVGVRLSPLRHEPVAVWVYRRNGAAWTLFERPDDGARMPPSPEIEIHVHRFTHRRYDHMNMLAWKGKGRVFAVVATAEPEEMARMLCRGIDRDGGATAALASGPFPRLTGTGKGVQCSGNGGRRPAHPAKRTNSLELTEG